MARDNEKLLQLIDESQKLLKQKLGEAIAADASTETLSYFMEACRAMESAGNSLGERRYLEDLGCRPVPTYEPILHGIETLHQRLNEIEQRIEGGDRNA